MQPIRYLTGHRGNLVCICGHYDRVHEDIDDGTRFGRWGEGRCQRCACKEFEPVPIYGDETDEEAK